MSRTKHTFSSPRRASSQLPFIVALTVGGVVAGCGQGSNGTGGATATDTAAMTATPTNASAATNATGSGTTASGTASASGSVPTAVAAVGTHGEDLYDAVKAGNWTKASSITDSLGAAVRALPSSGAASADQQQLVAELDTLRRAVPAKQQSSAIKAANRVTYLEARMTAQYRPATPAEVLLMDYYGRELEIWSAETNVPKLNQTSVDLQQTWNALRPAVQARGGAGQATHTDSLVKNIAAAKAPAEYARQAKPLLDEVDELEKVFTKL